MNLNNKMIYVKKENFEFLQFNRLLKYSNIITHCYSVGIDKNYRTSRGNKKIDEKEYSINLNNYKNLCRCLNLNYKNIIKARQAHTDNIEIINKVDEFETSENIDGLITNKKNIILATTNADCILLLFFDPVKKVIANVHSGWKGTLQEISKKAVRKMVEIYGCNIKDIIVCITPCIRKCHFEVDEDVYKMFLEKFKELENLDEIITKKNSKWYIDTVLINKTILKKIGILEENIEDPEICSVCNKDIIHSYRAEGETYGLSTCLISLI